MKNVRVLLLACVSALTCLAGCVTSPPRPAASAVPVQQPVSIQAFSRNPFLGVALPSPRMHRHEEAVKVLGSPIETVTRDVPSRHDPAAINSVFTLRYSFGELIYLHVPSKGVENLILIRLNGNQVPLKYGIRFGKTTREQITKLFGVPQERESNSVTYDVAYTQELTSPTTFFFRDDTLLEVDISSLMMD
jgi:hypothetical protein